MIQLKSLARRSSLLAMALAFGLGLVIPALSSPKASAASIMPTNRSVTPNSDLVNTNTTNANGVAYNPCDCRAIRLVQANPACAVPAIPVCFQEMYRLRCVTLANSRA